MLMHVELCHMCVCECDHACYSHSCILICITRVCVCVCVCCDMRMIRLIYSHRADQQPWPPNMPTHALCIMSPTHTCDLCEAGQAASRIFTADLQPPEASVGVTKQQAGPPGTHQHAAEKEERGKGRRWYSLCSCMHA